MNCTLRAVGDCDALLGDTLSFTSVGYAAWTRISSKRLWMPLTALDCACLLWGPVPLLHRKLLTIFVMN